jgi:hypothetical protein
VKRVSVWAKFASVVMVGAFASATMGACGGTTTTTVASTVSTTVSTTVTRTVTTSPAARTLAALRAQVQTERDKLNTLRGNVSDQQSTLQKLNAQVNGAQEAAKKSQFAGTGTYAVGTDILPGTYRASASPGCYWARLSSFNTSDIIDNDNADGPVIVTIDPSDKAFQANGCATFHRVG